MLKPCRLNVHRSPCTFPQGLEACAFRVATYYWDPVVFAEHMLMGLTENGGLFGRKGPRKACLLRTPRP